MSDFERRAVQRIIDKAVAAGVPIPDELGTWLAGHGGSTWPAREWARLHPDDVTGCCWGEVNRGPAGCLCWSPVYDVDQAAPVPPGSADDLAVRAGRCGDCAYRRDSPENADPWTADMLVELADGGGPFFCHDGMRRPARWEHPDGRVVDGCPHDWHPPRIAGVPYRADGQPGLLCAGWAAQGRRLA